MNRSDEGREGRWEGSGNEKEREREGEKEESRRNEVGICTLLSACLGKDALQPQTNP